MKTIKIKYHSNTPKLENIGGSIKSNWIDLYTAEDYELEQGNYYMLSLGVSMKIPDGYEAYIVPRSGTFKKYGLIQTNSMGVIDGSYCGNEDIWRMPVFAPITKDTLMNTIQNVLKFIELPQKEIEGTSREKALNCIKNGFSNLSKIIIPKGTRLCQFRIQKQSEQVEFIEDDLSKTNRGGFGSTGE